MSIEYNNIGIEQEGDILFVTVGKFKLFLKHGKTGQDAYFLYSHLMFTARLQKTNTVKAVNQYLRNATGWTKERLSKAKKLLNDFGLIKTITRTDQSGRIIGWYIEVKVSTTVRETSCLENQDTGNLPQMLKPEKKCLNNKEKEGFKTHCYKKFVKPSIPEIQEHLNEKGINNFDAEQFYNFYESKNWMIGKNKMSSWKAAVATWEKRNTQKPKKDNRSFRERNPFYENMTPEQRQKIIDRCNEKKINMADFGITE
jgi:hypothetical protein